ILSPEILLTAVRIAFLFYSADNCQDQPSLSGGSASYRVSSGCRLSPSVSAAKPTGFDETGSGVCPPQLATETQQADRAVSLLPQTVLGCLKVTCTCARVRFCRAPG